MGAARHQSGEKEKDEGRDERRERQDRLRRERQHVAVEDFSLMEIDVQDPARRPKRHRGEGEGHDRAVWLDLQRLPQLADRATIIVRWRKGGGDASVRRLITVLRLAVTRRLACVDLRHARPLWSSGSGPIGRSPRPLRRPALRRYPAPPRPPSERRTPRPGFFPMSPFALSSRRRRVRSGQFHGPPPGGRR